MAFVERDRARVTAPLDPGLLALAMAQSPELVVISDAELRCRFASDSVLTATGLSRSDTIGWDLLPLIHSDDWVDVEAMRARITPGNVEQLDVRMRLADGWHLLNVRVQLLVDGPDRWFLFTGRDVTRDRANQQALDRKVELERLLERVQRRFIDIAPGDIDDAVSWALEEISRFLGADRGYVLTYDHAARTESMTHEWIAEGISPDIHTYQDISWDLVPTSINRNLALEISAVPDVANLGDEWAEDREFFEADGLRSLLELPFAIDGVPAGNIGFDWERNLATWTDDDLRILWLFAATFAQIIARQRSERELAQTMHQLRMGFEGSPVPLGIISTDGILTRANPELCRLLQRDAVEIEGRLAIEVVIEEHRDRVRLWALAAVSTDADNTVAIEVALATGSGEERWGRIEGRPMHDEAGTTVGFVTQITDISSRKLTEVALSESESRFRTLVDNLPDPVIRITGEGEVLFANAAAESDLLRRQDGGFDIDPDALEMLRVARVESFRHGETRTVEHRLKTRLGWRQLETRFVPEVDASGDVRSLLLVASDLTERRRTEEELAYRATHDDLTGLPNRALFLSHLHMALSRLQRSDGGVLGVLFFDLDRFKVVNDSLGHAVGDDLLYGVANRLRGALRSGEVVARLGGDEFTVLVTGCDDAQEVLAVVDRFQAALDAPLEVAGRQLSTTASIGVAVTTTGTEGPDELLRWADAAMYRAKEQGRARASLFDESLHREVLERLELDQRLRQAIEHDELEVYYQPEVELGTNRILGAEALLRWNTPDGVLSAASFIGLAEETGLIVPIGRWVLTEACTAAARWHAAQPDREFVMRVNLSARQLDEADIVDQVAEVLEATGLAAHLLCLEITETALMSNAEQARVLLERLDSLGVWLAVDDFGTGYSSLSYLKRFPVDVLKIDRSFVDGIPGDIDDLAIVTTIIRLAESLNMSVTAEGIETQEQADGLFALGCRRGQGYHFARPMPMAELEARWTAED